MAKIIIKKGFVSQGGQLHKAGEVIEIKDQNTAKRMVARSGGDLDFYHGGNSNAEKPEEEPNDDMQDDTDAGGDLDFYHGGNSNAEKPEEEPNDDMQDDTDAGGDDTVSDSDNAEGAGTEEDAGIPAIDPDAGVGIAGKAGGKGKKK